MNEACTLWPGYRALPSPQLQSQWLRSLQDHLSDFDHRGLVQVCATWEKWCGWCGVNSGNVAAPNVMQVSAFVRTHTKTRAGAVALRNRLRFLENHLGVQLHATNVAVKQVLHAQSSAPKEVVVLAPRDVLSLWCWANSCNTLVSFFAKFCLVMVLGSIRFRHAQRSVIVELTEHGAVFEAHRGKARQGGFAAPPFRWYVARFTFCEKKLDVLASFAKDWKTVAGSCSYLMPGIRGATLLQATEWLGTDMSSGQF